MRTIGKLRRVGLIGLATLLAGVLTSAGAAPAVAEEPTYDIHGVVDFEGVPQGGVRVCVTLPGICVVTDDGGRYSMSGVAQLVRIYAEASSGASPWITTWYDRYTDETIAPQWDLASPIMPASVDIHLQAAPTVSGTVFSTTGARVGGALVCVEGSTNCATANAQGRYRLFAQIPYRDLLTLVATASGYRPAVKATSVATKVKIVLAKVKPPRITSAKPKLLGTKKVGKKLRVKRGSWGPGSLHFSYRWYRNGHRISGATKRTYRLTWADWRKNITVKVVATKPGYRKAVRSSKSTGWIRWSTWRHR